MFHVTFFKSEPPILDADPQEGDDCTAVKVSVDGRAEQCLTALLALNSFEVAHALAAVYSAGVSAGERGVRCRPSAAAAAPG